MGLDDAYAHLRAGRFAEAEALLRRMVQARPGHPEAHEMLGVVLAQGGRPSEAIECFDRAIALRPDSAGARHNRAQALFTLGRTADARAELERAVAQKPDFAAAWNLLGNVLAAQHDPGAEPAYRRALTLRPDHPEAHYNLGVYYLEKGRLDEAIACNRKALALRPDFVAAHNNLANALRARGRHDEALGHYARAVELEPRFADGWSNYGAALRETGRVDEAIPVLERAVKLSPLAWSAVSNLGIAYLARNRFYEAIGCQRRALELKPDSAEVLTHLANALAGVGQFEEAEAAYRKAIEWAPDFADAHNNLGMLRSERGDVAGATASFRAALELRPDFSEATQNLGFLLQQEGRTDEAIELYRRALALDPRNARAGYNLGIVLVSRQEFAEGWDLCERRFDTIPPVTIRRAFPFPPLEAADLGKGRRIAIWKEQGVGDQLLYSTLLAELAARGERFVAEIDARLVPAFRRAHPDWPVVSPEESAAAFAQCDRHVAAGSLPRLLRRTLESFDGQPQRLLVPPAPGEVRTERRSGRLRIGISWRTFQPRVRGELSRRKSASLAAFLELSKEADLVDLQYGDTAHERDEFEKAGGRLERIAGLDLFNDLDGLLGAIEGCDVVVTTSNVTAHLAGAIGKRALVMFLHDRAPFHYWASPSGRSLWYPSVELVTAPGLDTWEKALAEARRRLAP